MQLREWLESIFRTLPSDEQQEIVRRAKVKDKDECDGGFLELVLRKLFAGLELNVTPHPRIRGVNTRPDFLVGQGGKNCYVEAVVTGHSPFNLNSNEEKVIELLNENLSSPKFCIGAKMEGKLKTTLGKRQVVPRFRQLLADHAFEEVQHHYNHVGMYHTPSATIECGDWRLIGWLHPAKDSDRALAPRQDIVFHPYHAKFLIGNVQSVRERIRKKAGNYGCPDHPLVVAVAPRDMYVASPEIQRDTLFGTSYVHYSNSDSRPTLKRGSHYPRTAADEGVLHQFPQLAGALMCEKINIDNITRATARLFLNPFCDKAADLPDRMYCLPYDKGYRVQGIEIRMECHDGIPFSQLLGLN